MKGTLYTASTAIPQNDPFAVGTNLANVVDDNGALCGGLNYINNKLDRVLVFTGNTGTTNPTISVGKYPSEVKSVLILLEIGTNTWSFLPSWYFDYNTIVLYLNEQERNVNYMIRITY